MLFIFVIHWAFCCCDFCCSCVLTFGKNSCDLKEKRKKSAKREVYTHVYTFCHWECERGKENEQNRVKVPKIWKIILFSEEKKKWQKNCRIIIYTFLLYKFSWVLFSQRSFANHLCDCYRLSFDSYTISTFTSFFFFKCHMLQIFIHFVWQRRNRDGGTLINGFYNGFTTHCLLYMDLFYHSSNRFFFLLVWIISFFNIEHFQSLTLPNVKKNMFNSNEKFERFINEIPNSFLHNDCTGEEKNVWHISNVTTVQSEDFHFTLTYEFNDRFF